MGLILEGNRSWKNFPKKLSLSVAWVTYSALIGPIVDFVKDILYMLEREELGRNKSRSFKNLDDNPWKVYLSILCISFIVSPFFHKQRISEEFKKSCWRGFLQLFCSLPILSELYNYPLLLKNTINTGFHEKEIEAETDPFKITIEKAKLREEKAFPVKLTSGTTDRDFFFENIPQSFLQLRYFLMMLTWERYDFSQISVLSKISPFMSLASVGFTAWKKYMNRKGVQNLSKLEMLLSILPMFVFTYFTIFFWSFVTTLRYEFAIALMIVHYLSFFIGYVQFCFCRLCCRCIITDDHKREEALTKYKQSTLGASLLSPKVSSGPWFVLQMITLCLGSLALLVFFTVYSKSSELYMFKLEGPWYICTVILCIICPFCLGFVKWFFKPFNRYRFTSFFTCRQFGTWSSLTEDLTKSTLAKLLKDKYSLDEIKEDHAKTSVIPLPQSILLGGHYALLSKALQIHGPNFLQDTDEDSQTILHLNDQKCLEIVLKGLKSHAKKCKKIDLEMQPITNNAEMWYNQKNENGQNFLHCLAQNQHFSFFLGFVKRAKIFGYTHLLMETDNAGHTPISYLIIQCTNKPKEAWKNLLKRLSDIDSLDNEVDADGNTLLHKTILAQNQNAFKELIKMANPDRLLAKNQDSKTPLHLATQEKIFWTIKPLTQAHQSHGVSVVPLDSEGRSPLHYLTEAETENGSKLFKEYQGVPKDIDQCYQRVDQ